MRLTLLGHAAFLIQTAGKTLVTDPYSDEIGYRPVGASADFVTISHHNPKWHSCLDAVGGDFELLQGLELVEHGAVRGEISFGAVQVFERPNEGENAMVWIEVEGLRVLHTGDCGVLPDDQTLQKCGRVDVLLALAGGSPTLSLDDLMILVGQLAPKIVIPMHFGVPGLQMSALGIEEIEKRFETHQIVRSGDSALEITRESLPAATQLHVLKPARLAPFAATLHIDGATN